MKHFVVAVAVLFVGFVAFSDLSTSPVQASTPKGTFDEWALFNTSSNTWSKKLTAVKSENSEWVLFNTSTDYWKADGDILPSKNYGIDFEHAANASATKRSFN